MSRCFLLGVSDETVIETEVATIFDEHDMIIQHHFQSVQNFHPTMPRLTQNSAFSLQQSWLSRKYENVEAAKTWLPTLPSDL